MKDVFAVAPDDVWLVGEAGVILHYDGTAWTYRAPPAGYANRTLSKVWGSASDDVWLLGSNAILHWTGAGFDVINTTVADIHGTDRNNVWIRATPPQRWNGSAFVPQGTAAELGGTYTTLTALATFGPCDTWVADDDGRTFHWDGARWEQVPTFNNDSITGLEGTSGTDVWASTDDGSTLRWDGSRWNFIEGRSLDSARMELAFVGGEAWMIPLARFTGGRWTAVDEPGDTPLIAISGTAPNDLWGVTQAGALSYFDGNAWSPIPFRAKPGISSVFVAAPNDVWTASSGVAHWDGARWQRDLRMPWATIVTGTSPTDVWAFQSLGTAFHFDGTTWEPRLATFALDLNAAFAVGPRLAFMVGRSGAVAKWDGSTWSSMSLPFQSDLYAVWASDENNVWVSGATVRKHDGSTWVSADWPANTGFPRELFGFGPLDVWAGSGTGQLHHYDGSTWTKIVDRGPTQPVRAIWGTSSQDLWVVFGSIIEHYDGSTWTPHRAPVSGGIYALSGSSAEDVWFVGGTDNAPAVLRKTSVTTMPLPITGVEGPQVTAFPQPPLVAVTRELASTTVPIDCADDGYCSLSLPGSYALSDVYASGPDDVWMAGTVLTRWDGSRVTKVTLPVAGPYTAVHGSGPGNVWVAASDHTLLQFDGTTWQQHQPPDTMTGSAGYEAMWVSSPTNVVVAWRNRAWHYTGTWTQLPTPPWSIEGVFAPAADEIWITGFGARRLNGGVWETPNGTSSYARRIWGVSSSDLWIADFGGRLHHREGQRWTEYRGLGSVDDLSGTSSSDVWAVGMTALVHFDGSQWVRVDVDPGSLARVAAAGPGQVWHIAATSSGKVERVRLVGDSAVAADFTALVSRDPAHGVWGSAPDDVWFSGWHLRHWDGTRLWAHPPAVASAPFDSSGSISGWARGEFAASSAGAWLVTTSPGAPAVMDGRGPGTGDVWASSATNVWAAGGDYSPAHYDGVSWKVVSFGSALYVVDVIGFDPDDVWVLDGAGVARHWDGTGWETHPIGATTSFYALWGLHSSDLWAVGAGGAAAHFDGVRWTRFDTGTRSDLFDVAGLATDDVTAVGDRGAIVHWSGRYWQPVRDESLDRITSVAGVPGGEMWMTSAGGTLIVRRAGTPVPDAGYGPGESGSTIPLCCSASDGGARAAPDAGITFEPDAGLPSAAVPTPTCSDGWCWDHPLPSGNDLRTIYGSTWDDVWAAGESGAFFHYDGTGWTTQRDGIPGDTWVIDGAWDGTVMATGAFLDHCALRNGVWQQEVASAEGPFVALHVESAHEAYAIDVANGLFRFDGVAWWQDEMYLNPSGAPLALWGSGPDDVWIAGEGGSVIHGTASGWTTARTYSYSAPSLTAIAGNAGDDFWIVGDRSTILRGDASGVTPVTDTLPTANFHTVAVTPFGDVFVGGTGGIILRKTEGGWATTPTGTTATILSIFGTIDWDMWAVGSGGVFLHYDGVAWSALHVGERRALTAVVAASNGSALAVGPSGTFMQRFPDGWKRALPALGGHLGAFVADGSVWLGASGSIERWGDSLSDVITLSGGLTIDDIWGSSADNIIAVAASGYQLHRYDGSSWTREQMPVADITAIHGSASNDVWAVGSSVLHYEGSSWTERPTGSYESLSAVFSFARDDAWMGGANGRVLHWNGNAFEAHPISTWNAVRALWGLSSSNLYAAVESRLEHWDGTIWSEVQIPLFNGTVLAIGGDGTRIVVGGRRGRVAWFDGQGWHVETLPTNGDITDALVDADGKLVVAGQTAIVARHDGVAWRVMQLGTTFDILSVTSDGLDGFTAIDDSSTLFEGSRAWRASIQSRKPEAIWRAPDGTLFGVAAYDLLRQGANGDWSSVGYSPSRPLSALWGTSSTDIWAVGDNGTAAHYDGLRLVAEPGFTTEDLTVISGSGPDDIWVVAESRLWHRGPGGWSSSGLPTYQRATAVVAINPWHAYAAGGAGTIARWNGVRWMDESIGRLTEEPLVGLAVSPDGDVYAVGSGGVILRKAAVAR